MMFSAPQADSVGALPAVLPGTATINNLNFEPLSIAVWSKLMKDANIPGQLSVPALTHRYRENGRVIEIFRGLRRPRRPRVDAGSFPACRPLTTRAVAEKTEFFAARKIPLEPGKISVEEKFMSRDNGLYEKFSIKNCIRH